MEHPMGCRCNTRRAAILLVRDALRAGDTQKAAEQAKFVISTMAQDAGRSLASRVTAAKQRLGRR
jgi:hypothetical protein